MDWVIQYDINDLLRKSGLFKAVFKGKPYPEANAFYLYQYRRPYPRAHAGYAYQQKEPYSADKATPLAQEEVKRSVLGTPLFFPLTFIDQSQRLTLPNAPLIQVQGKKTVVKTAVAGRDFTVKEIISASDYQIDIWGFALKEHNTSDDHIRLFSEVFPSNHLADLNNWYRKNTALGIECELLRILGINRLVIEEICFPVIEGSVGLLPYEIRAVSDTDMELEIKEDY